MLQTVFMRSVQSAYVLFGALDMKFAGLYGLYLVMKLCGLNHDTFSLMSCILYGFAIHRRDSETLKSSEG